MFNSDSFVIPATEIRRPLLVRGHQAARVKFDLLPTVLHIPLVHRSTDPHRSPTFCCLTVSPLLLPPWHPESAAKTPGRPNAQTFLFHVTPQNVWDIPQKSAWTLQTVWDIPRKPAWTPKPRGTSLTNQPRPPKTLGRSSKSSSPSHLVSILSGFPPKTRIMSPTWLHLKRPNLRQIVIFFKKTVVF
jgi:hypothetical protein